MSHVTVMSHCKNGRRSLVSQICTGYASGLRRFSNNTPLLATKLRKSKNVNLKKTFDSLNKQNATLRGGVDFHRDIARLGFRNAHNVIQMAMNEVSRAMRYGQSPRETAKAILRHEIVDYTVDNRLTTEESKRFNDPQVLSSLYCRVAIEMLEPERIATWKEVGVYLLAVAVEFGHINAAIALCNIDRTMPILSTNNGTARTIVKNVALDRGDWRAMSLYVDDLLRNKSNPATRKEGYEMALDLLNIVKPGPFDLLQPQWKIKHPWRVLKEAADQHLYDCKDGPEAKAVQESYDRALRDGAKVYTDPEACNLLANSPSVELYSDEWLELKTKSAMSGDPESCFEVGKYWLEKHRWYPCQSIPSSELGNDLGFEWMELSASLAVGDARTIALRYLALALVLRENNRMDAGLLWLQKGIQQIEDTVFEEDQAKEWREKLQDFEQAWHSNFSATAAETLGPPLMLKKSGNATTLPG